MNWEKLIKLNSHYSNGSHLPCLKLGIKIVSECPSCEYDLTVHVHFFQKVFNFREVEQGPYIVATVAVILLFYFLTNFFIKFYSLKSNNICWNPYSNATDSPLNTSQIQACTDSFCEQ